jgi:hypothetical protein
MKAWLPLKSTILFLTIFAIAPLSIYSNDIPPELSHYSYSLYELSGEFGKETKVPISSILDFNMYSYQIPASSISKNSSSILRNAAIEFWVALFNGDLQKFKQFFEEKDLDQCAAFISQRKSLFTQENGFELDKIFLDKAVETDNWASFSFQLKGNDKTIPSVLRFRRNSDGNVKADFSTKMNLVDELFVDATFGFGRLGRLETYEPKKYSHTLTLATYPNDTKPVITYEFNTLKSGDPQFDAVAKFFSSLIDLLKENKTEAFLNQLDDKKPWIQQWDWEKSKGVYVGPPDLVKAWKDIYPVAALDLDPVIVMYFSDQQKTKIMQIRLFLKKGNTYSLLNQRIDTMYRLYSFQTLENAALERVPFNSLKRGN